MIPAIFICAAPIAVDGDTLRCASGIAVRIAGVESNERRGGCHLPVCPTMPAAQAKATVQRLVHRQRLTCTPVGRSFARIVADCQLPDGRSLSCAVIASGAGVRWDSYWRRYRMRSCG